MKDLSKIDINFNKLNELLEETKTIFLEDRKIAYKNRDLALQDRDRAIEHYEMLKKQYELILEELPYSDEGILEKEMNNALKIANDAQKHLSKSQEVINDTQKTLVPVITSLSKTLDVLIKSQAFANSFGKQNNSEPLDLNKLSLYLEDE